MPYSQTTEQNIHKHFITRTTWTIPAALYVGLSTGGTSKTSAGTEVSGGSYARKQVATTDWEATLTGSDIVNITDIEFATATANWGTVTTAIFFSAVTGGTFLGYITLTTAKAVNNGQTAKFAVGDLTWLFT
jgi:hypothetical protein